MEPKQILRREQIHKLSMEYLASALVDINVLRKEVHKVQHFLNSNKRVTVHQFIMVALKIRNIANRCAEITYNSEKLCHKYLSTPKENV